MGQLRSQGIPEIFRKSEKSWVTQLAKPDPPLCLMGLFYAAQRKIASLSYVQACLHHDTENLTGKGLG